MTIDSSNSNRQSELDSEPRPAPAPHSQWLGRLRNVLFIGGVVFGITAVVLMLVSGTEWGIMILGWGSAFCLVGSGNALVWKYALARRNPSVTRSQLKLQRVVLTVGLACASVGAVAALIYVYLIAFFTIMSSDLRLGI
jgi:hypothetical protein